MDVVCLDGARFLELDNLRRRIAANRVDRLRAWARQHGAPAGLHAVEAFS